MSDFDHLKILPTNDGSLTVYNGNYGENCHSTHGAKEETLLHYIGGTKLADRLSQAQISILEVGFGTGLGFLTTIEFLKEKQFKGKLIYKAFEMDRPTIELAKDHYPILKDLEQQDQRLILKTDTIELTILLGNARETIQSLIDQDEQFDCIYQDAFSPKRNPILWTIEWFRDLKKLSHSKTIMSTYSASSSIRKSMKEAGWILKKGEKFGPKRTSTRALCEDENDPDILLNLSRSPVDALTDDQLK